MSFIFRESTIRILDRASVLFAVVAIGLVQWLNGLWGGFVYGGESIGNYHRPLPPEKISFWISDSPDPFSGLALYSAYGIVVFIVFKLIEGKTSLQLAALVPLLIGASFLWKLYSIIDLDSKNPDVYFELLRLTRLEQWVGFVAFMLAVLLHLLSILVRIKSKRAFIE